MIIITKLIIGGQPTPKIAHQAGQADCENYGDFPRLLAQLVTLDGCAENRKLII